MSACAIPLSRPVPIAEVPVALRLQVVSTAGAGFPSPAQDWEETAIDLVELLRLDRAASFVFRVSGQSMIDAGIHDDDVVVVDRDAIPTSGRIVIAVVDSGFVIRQIVWRDGKPLLEARNARMRYEPVVADENVEVWGVVRACVRNLQG
jgi:DNA polymerase V|nr:translesion error-prone DNA polymerase V autoproteolytic subunit [uncultured Sphingomonas sp.]